jgi:hypothetical protein
LEFSTISRTENVSVSGRASLLYAHSQKLTYGQNTRHKVGDQQALKILIQTYDKPYAGGANITNLWTLVDSAHGIKRGFNAFQRSCLTQNYEIRNENGLNQE